MAFHRWGRGRCHYHQPQPWAFCRAAGYVLLQQTPWGFITGLLWGSNEKIDVKVLYKWKLLFSTKSREFSSTPGDKAEPCEAVYPAQHRGRPGPCNTKDPCWSGHVINVYWHGPRSWHTSWRLASVREESKHKAWPPWRALGKWQMPSNK